MNRSQFETLENRTLFAVTAVFSQGVLGVFGDNNANTITVSRDATGTLLVNGGAVTIRGGTPTVDTTRLIQIAGRGNNDVLSLDEANGVLPKTTMNGGSGNDTMTGGSGDDKLSGQGGNDNLFGKGGVDLLFGGGGADALTGGDADDKAFGQSGDDRMIWNPGEDTDLNEGGAGIDTVEVIGGGGNEQFTVAPNGQRVKFDRVDPAPFAIDIGTSEKLLLTMAGGDDTFTGTTGLADLIQITVDGGAGNDTILGGDGDELLQGGDGNDFIDGNKGDDRAEMGAGDDTFQWDPGDGSDTIEGQDGRDEMLFNGAGGNENFDVAANGQRVRFFRDAGNITMDLDDTEVITLNALGGLDNTVVNDVSGTDLTDIYVHLSGVIDGTDGDTVLDQVTVNGSNDDDAMTIAGGGKTADVLGLFAEVHITGADPSLDALIVNALGGDDSVDASGLETPGLKLTVNAGAGDDTVDGSEGDDLLVGGDGDDVLDGGDGNDTLQGEAGDDVLLNGEVETQ